MGKHYYHCKYTPSVVYSKYLLACELLRKGEASRNTIRDRIGISFSRNEQGATGVCGAPD
jgi:hypothetical protein